MLTTYLLENDYKHKAIYNTFFIKKSGFEIILTQVYVDDIIFGSINMALSKKKLMLCLEISRWVWYGELSFF